NINTQYFNIFHGPSPFFENRNSMLAHYDAVFKGWVISLGYLDFLIVIPAGGKFRRIAHPQ
ncbi:hypothetical protein ACTNFI_10680, partial [Coxiella burnetii]